MPSNYDKQKAARMLALLMATKPEQQMDTLAAVCRAWLDRHHYDCWGQDNTKRPGPERLREP